MAFVLFSFESELSEELKEVGSALSDVPESFYLMEGELFTTDVGHFF
jgi:hypothetical protein